MALIEWHYNSFSNGRIQLLKDNFDGSIISRNGDVNWPTRLCDLTAFDYHAKSPVCENNPQLFIQWQDEVIHVINEIESELCQKYQRKY